MTYRLTGPESKAVKALLGVVRDLQQKMVRAQGALDGVVNLIASQQYFQLTGTEMFAFDEAGTELTVTLPEADDRSTKTILTKAVNQTE